MNPTTQQRLDQLGRELAQSLHETFESSWLRLLQDPDRLQELGAAVPRSGVGARDLAQLVTALKLMEQRNTQLEARLTQLEQQNRELSATVEVLGEGLKKIARHLAG